DLCKRVKRRVAGCQAVSPTVPRTLNSEVILIDETFAQRAAPMRASVVQRVDLAVDVEQRDRAPVDFHEHCLPGWQVRRICYFDKLEYWLIHAKRLTQTCVVTRRDHLSNPLSRLSSLGRCHLHNSASE